MMTELEINHFLTEIISGKKVKIHYDEWDDEKTTPKYIPSGKPWRTHFIDSQYLPNFTGSWAHYGQLLEWAMKQEWILELKEKLFDNYNHYEVMQILLNPLRGSTAIAEFLKEKE